MSFGIDFGTTNSVLAHFDGKEAWAVSLEAANLDDWSIEGFDQLFPTVVGWSSTRPKEKLFGWEAKLRSDESVAAVKRLLRGDEQVTLAGQKYTAPTVSAGFFETMRSRAADQGHDVRQSVLTVPANAIGAARYRTRAAARFGGVQVQALINEPTAAAIAYAQDAPGEARRILVFDWGGGTIDVTILDYDQNLGFFEERATRGITELGGLEMDARLERLMLRKLGTEPDWSPEDWRTFRLDVERTKITLSMDDFARMELPDRSRTLKVERAEFEAEIEDLVTRSLQPLRDCLSDLQCTARDLDAVLLIGGTSQIPMVRDRVEEILEMEAVDSELCEPMTAVARGAAIASAIMTGELDSVLSVSATHSLGLIVFNADDELTFSEIIPRNAALPTEESGPYWPKHDNQTDVLLQVIEGDPALPLDDPENFPLAKISVPIPPDKTRDENSFKVTYRYDESGILHVKAVMKEDGKVVLDGEVNKFGEHDTDAGVTPETLREFWG